MLKGYTVPLSPRVPARDSESGDQATLALPGERRRRGVLDGPRSGGRDPAGGPDSRPGQQRARHRHVHRLAVQRLGDEYLDPLRSQYHESQELSVPPHVTFSELKGVSLFTGRTILSGGGDELVDLARDNLG